MKSDIILFAQDLENKSNDILMHNDKIVSNMQKLQELKLLTSEVPLKGKKIIDDKNIKVFLYKDKFSMVIPTNTNDKSGREAPILLYASIYDDKDLIKKNIDNFLKITTRTVDKNQILEIIYSLYRVYKKEKNKKIIKILISIAISLLLYLIVKYIKE